MLTDSNHVCLYFKPNQNSLKEFSFKSESMFCFVTCTKQIMELCLPELHCYVRAVPFAEKSLRSQCTNKQTKSPGSTLPFIVGKPPSMVGRSKGHSFARILQRFKSQAESHVYRSPWGVLWCSMSKSHNIQCIQDWKLFSK